MKLFIILFCLLLFLSIIAMVIGFIGDRTDQFPIWKTQAWTTLRLPVIIISVILIITVLVIIFSRMADKQSKTEQEFALSQGWTYTESHRDPQRLTKDLQTRLEKVCPKKYFDVGDIMTVESGR